LKRDLIFETDFKTGIEIYFLVELNSEIDSWFHFCVEPKPKKKKPNQGITRG
jgi:hypothetical protein